MPKFPALLLVRVEPELKDALGAAADRDRTNVAKFVRRELRGIVKARLAHNDDGGPAPFRPDRGQRVAA